MVRRWMVAALVVTAAGGAAGCSTPSVQSGVPATSVGTPTATTPPATTATPAPATPAPATPAPATPAPATPAGPTPTVTPSAAPAARAPDPLAFFRAQEGPCRRYALQVGNPAVEPDRFRGATVLRDLGNGATQIRDGRGVRLVVVPRRGIVLPASGRTTDVMPLPYEFGCSEKVFVGGSHD